MQGSWNNDQTYYRCTYPSQYALANQVHHPRAVYLREAEVLPELDAWLRTVAASRKRKQETPELTLSAHPRLAQSLIDGDFRLSEG